MNDTKSTGGAVEAIDLDSIILRHGAHATREDGMCAEEAVAALAGLGHTDSPACASRVIAACMRRLNDAGWSSDEARTAGLRRWLLPQIGTATDDAGLEQRRAFAAADVAVREIAPRALETAGRSEDAARLRARAPIVDRETARAAAAADAADAAAYAARGAVYAARAARAARAADDDDAARAARGAVYAARGAAYAAAAADDDDAAARAARGAAYAAYAAADARAADARAAADAADADAADADAADASARDEVLTWAAERLMTRMLEVT